MCIVSQQLRWLNYELAAVTFLRTFELFAPCFIGELRVLVFSVVQGPKDVENRVQQLGTSELKVTKFHFYFHDLRVHTSITVASANSTASSQTLFGVTSIMDDPLTEGPEFSPKQVGRVQGLYASVSVKEFTVICALTLVFTNEKSNGRLAAH
ncbi:hypothetical protein POM88_048707 [Heracleum sosnowskyi]|uniref:Dirigent protein n=1 Tax=Heracleum sosnowskyi TaxID=360622 RepID=A0AAD8GWV6_9APIA|nr:hypothetical protein POM88_048707 [Heracleum sosnowskyi]